MKDTITVIRDSLTKAEIKGDFTEHYIAIDGVGYTVQLTADSLKKVQAALKPFTEGEDTTVTPEQRYSPLRKARAAREEGANSLPPEVRAAIAKFVEEKGLGKVSKGGLVRKAFITAWEEAGRPGLDV